MTSNYFTCQFFHSTYSSIYRDSAENVLSSIFRYFLCSIFLFGILGPEYGSHSQFLLLKFIILCIRGYLVCWPLAGSILGRLLVYNVVSYFDPSVGIVCKISEMFRLVSQQYRIILRKQPSEKATTRVFIPSGNNIDHNFMYQYHLTICNCTKIDSRERKPFSLQ